MAERIVDGFETIKINEHEGETGALSSRIGHPLFEPVVDQHAVRQARKRVARGKEFDAFLGRFTLGDVCRGTGHAQCATGRVAFGDLAF